MKSRTPLGPDAVPVRHRLAKKVAVPRWLLAALAAAVLVLLITAVSGRDAAPAAEPAPAPAATRTVTKTVEVPTVPKECLAALDAADTGFDYAAEAMQYAGDGFTAAASYDIDGMVAASDGITTVNGKLSGIAPTYTSNREACRSAAK